MDFVIDRTDNQHIIDHSIWAFERYDATKHDALEEFYLEWIDMNTMPNFGDYING